MQNALSTGFVFLGLMLRYWLGVLQHFQGMQCLHLKGLRGPRWMDLSIFLPVPLSCSWWRRHISSNCEDTWTQCHIPEHLNS